MYILLDVEKNDGTFELKRVAVRDEDIVKIIDQYFEAKGIKIQETGII